MNWKHIFVLMLVAGSNKPTEEQIASYISALLQHGEVISLDDFTMVSKYPLFHIKIG